MSNSRPSSNPRNENKGKNEERYVKATGRKVTTRKPKPQLKNETPTKNIFSLLSEKKGDLLIGDSMVKDQGEHFGFKNKMERKVRSYSGASAKIEGK